MKPKATIFIRGLLFLFFLASFVFNSGWYEPARFVVSGVAETTDAAVDARWDSGSGFNGYEQQQFRFLSTRGDAHKTIRIVIKGSEKKNPASRGNRVILSEIRVDERGVPVPRSALNKVRRVPGEGLILDSADSEVTLNLTANQRVYFLFKTNNRSGIARIFIDGKEEKSVDLYRGNWEIQFSRINFWLLNETGDFSVSFSAPRYDVDSLRIGGKGISEISSVYLQGRDGRIALPFVKSDYGDLEVRNPTAKLKHYYHPAHFIFQVIFAFLVAWLVGTAFQSANRYGLRGLFVAEKRWIFWLLFAGALGLYGIWLAAFWPGIMSVDSLNIWRAALLPHVMINNHPIVNEIWYLCCQQFWQHIAVVPIIQIILLSALLATTYFLAFRRGVRGRWLLPCYLLTLVSVPIGLYNVTLWKDVPFALLVVFWALYIAYLFLQKHEKGMKRVSLGQAIFLLLLFIGLLTFRHNGLIYLVVIPALLFFLGLLKVPKSILLVGFLTAVGLVFFVVFPPKGIKGASYFQDLSRKYLHQIGEETVASRLSEAVIQYPRLLDIKKNQHESDFWHYYLADRYAYKFIREAGWNDVYPYRAPQEHPFPELRSVALTIYHASLEYPWLYMSWYPFVFLYAFPLCLLLCRWLPLSALFSVVILVQVAGLLVFVGTGNWRYYYFVLLGGYFLLPLFLMDLHSLKLKRATTEK